MYLSLLAVIYLAFISLGLPDSLLGSGWPVMYETFGVPVSHMGIVTMVISACTIISSLTSDALIRKTNTQTVTIVSNCMTAIALLGFSNATEFWMLIVFAIPYGLGGGSIDAVLNHYVALHYSPKHMSWLHCFWGVGTIISPFVMSYAIMSSDWTHGYSIVAFIQAGISIILLLTLPLWKVNKTKNMANDQGNSTSLLGAVKIKGVPCLLLGFLAYCAAEATVMGWASTYLAEVRNIPEERAAAFASLFFIGLTAGRFLGGFLMDRLGDRKMILLGTVISTLGVVCIFIPTGADLFSLAGFIIIGLGFAPIYPCIIHSTASNFGAENAGAIIGIQMASAYVGATFMPPLYGLLGRAIGFEIMPIYLLIFLAFMIILIEKTFRLTHDQ